jgi:hypothetical protein
MIVNVTRGDLRDEFSMADEAFALSPISARAAQPREEDYDAISEAFMETSRGRWFLGEYAKRNRNADTRMVLDAVARIEQSLAAQKQPEPEPVPDTGLADALSAIKAALNEARAAASAAVDSLALEQHLAPVRKGARVIREISWRWREIGADGRICDLIDSQVSAIEASCGQISSADPNTAVSAAFDLIGSRIAAFDDSGDASGPVAATAPAPTDAPAPMPSLEAMPAAAAPKAETVASHVEATATSETAPAEALVAEAPVAAAPAATEANVESANVIAETSDAEVSDVTAAATAPEAVAAMEAPAEIAAMTSEAADAHDEAVLDMIAAEMSAPDDSDDDFGSEPAEMQLDDLPPAEPEMIASSTIASSEVSTVPAVAPVEPSAPQAIIEPAPEPSLGSTLIANGFLRKSASASDPLAALRRLSQIEKIALFS